VFVAALFTIMAAEALLEIARARRSGAGLPHS
jgi:hypothetical protein